MKITFFSVSYCLKKIDEICGWGGKGVLVKVIVRTSGRKREYCWMSALTSHSRTADIHISIPSCVLSVLISATKTQNFFIIVTTVFLLIADKHNLSDTETSTETFISGLNT